MEETYVCQPIGSDNELGQKGNRLWQNYPKGARSVRAGDVKLEGAANEALEKDEETTLFWANYTELIEEAKKQRQIKTLDKALALAGDAFLSNHQQFKSVPIPLGKYFYPQNGWNPKAKLYLGLGAGWLFNFVLLGAGAIKGEFAGLLAFFQLGFGVYIVMRLVNLFANKVTQDIAIESNYIIDKARKIILAFKDISLTEETDKGLLIKNARFPNQKEFQLLIPNTTEEYVNIRRFMKQVEAVNQQQPNIYPSLKAVRNNYWQPPLTSFKISKRLVIYKAGVKGIGSMPTDWIALLGGIVTLSVFSFSGLHLPLLGFAGMIGGIYSLEIFKHSKRFVLKALHISDTHIKYVFHYNHTPYQINLPFDQIYGLKMGRRGLKILNKEGKSYWQTTKYPHKKYQPIIPKNMKGVQQLRIFLEEIVGYNTSR